MGGIVLHHDDITKELIGIVASTLHGVPSPQNDPWIPWDQNWLLKLGGMFSRVHDH